MGTTVGTVVASGPGTVLGAAICAGVGRVVGVGIDVVALAAEEKLTREDMKRDLLSAVSESLQPCRGTFECKAAAKIGRACREVRRSAPVNPGQDARPAGKPASTQPACRHRRKA